ncbi:MULTISPECIES: MFS transporter [unclassified Pseudonocardia]|uniref:MFS transporter n=1 Tax=unclassified Pseudonocardia TaxID=2619320 RepID=UPI00095D07A8|nr:MULTISPECIES: MFS transporter [unclassified Pseudonocardia]MBN9102372.1 hypothetical protein [Pseudonocardia sp.]OJY39289.1 MAG: hypothetical protein BGP03_23280 [Pseudonocardia sp. 73-21]
MNVGEGFDILVMAFAASGVAAEWGLGAAQIGVLLSSGLIGMALGSALVAPLGDRIGRRPMTLACLAIATVGMGFSALTTGFASAAVAWALSTATQVPASDTPSTPIRSAAHPRNSTTA